MESGSEVHASSSAYLAILLLATVSIGCAVPGEPLPPLLEIPAPVAGLTAQQVGTEIRVIIPVPQLTTEGTRPRHIERVDLYLAYTAAGALQPDFSSTPIRTWGATELPDGATELSHEIELDSGQIGRRAWLAARAQNHRGVDAGLSNLAMVDVANLPAAPGKISATVSERWIDLSWTAASGSVFTNRGALPVAVQYEVFRGDSGGTLEKIGAAGTATYRDETIALGGTYRYAVRAAIPSDVSVAITALSDPVEVAALDRFAPAAPADLRAIAVTGAVELAWSPNAEGDLAGYNVYREPLGEDGRATAPRHKLNAAPLDIPLFRDVGASPESRFRYAATAVDRDGNESAPSNEETVETE
jgi:hypothetical protein